MLLTVAALLLSLTACARPGPEAGLSFDPDFNKPQPRPFALACPTPTRAADKRKIAAELIATIDRAVPPDTLATEWERLNDGAISCRKGAP